MADHVPLLDRVLLARYRLVRPIAQGGMAEVWEGHDLVLARPVAIKVLHAHLASDEAFVERFRREAVAAARLAHPGIVATYDAGTDGEVAFIVMELVRGRTLRQALEQTGALPPSMAVPVAAEVADALEHAHRAGLVHRDVKPANILLTEHEGMTAPLLRVKVADFGIAKMELEGATGSLTQTGALVGTATYFSPEQVQGGVPDARSDEYALGVVLYEMLCGTPPFKTDSELATALQHVRAQPRPLRQHQPDLPPALEAVVLKAMAKDPNDRYPTAAGLRDALLALDEAVEEPDDAVPHVVRHATPPSGTPPTVRPPPPRRWVPVAALAALAAVAVVAVVALAGGDGQKGDGGGPSTTPQDANDVAIASVSSFDPGGSDGEENEDRAALAIDGNPATAWNTDTYNTRPFGGLKPGVGLVFRLDGAEELNSLEVSTGTTDWAASVFVADAAGRELAAWGEAVDSAEGIDGGTSFDLGGRRGGAVLLWLTDPGPGRRAEVGEVTLKG